MRESGILMHISSLPGPYGIGTMGKHAFAFVDFLAEAGQRCWQILPLNPTGFGDSPYQSCSAFAGNHYLIDLELLVEEGLLKEEELDSIEWCRRDTKADYGLLYENRLAVLKKAFARHGETEDFARFRAANDSWLPDYVAYMGLKDKFSGKPWYQWPEEVRRYTPHAIDAAWAYLGQEGIRFYCFTQYLFFRQWFGLRDYARSKNIRIIGDVPIYVPLDSVEVWKNPEQFQMDENLVPKMVAGCPPDAFTADGQLWGNPIYDWEKMKLDGFSWWIRRLEAAGALYDVVRLDHFRGLESYWAIPYGDNTAKNGRWVKGPGKDFIRAVKGALPELRMIAEDLGYLTREVLELRDFSGYPGMKVLQFAFDLNDEGAANDYLPHNYPENSIAYTGTHDNETMTGWFAGRSKQEIQLIRDYIFDQHTPKKYLPKAFIAMALRSVSRLCVIPIQDYLGLDNSARINKPAVLGSNWNWRMKPDALTPELQKEIAELTRRYGRFNYPEKKPEEALEETVSEDAEAAEAAAEPAEETK